MNYIEHTARQERNEKYVSKTLVAFRRVLTKGEEMFHLDLGYVRVVRRLPGSWKLSRIFVYKRVEN